MRTKFLTISNENEMGEAFGVIPSDLVDAFVPYGQVVKSGYMGEKGQWSWNQKEETLLFCIASNTWVNLYTLENIIKDNFIKHDESVEIFIPYSKLVSTNYKGIKGQWSYNQNENTLLYCIATNSWVNLYTLENIIKDNFIKHEQTIEMFVPVSNITSSSAKGIKGQWSYSKDIYYKCIATDTWIEIANKKILDQKILDIFNGLEEQYVSYGQLVASSFKGIKGQWSYVLDYLYLCIATDTWKIISDKNYVDAEDLKTRIGAGLESDGAYLADENTNYITQATSLKNADFRLDENIKRIDDVLNLVNDQYVPFGLLQNSGFKGIKGQWSYSDKKYYKCIATDTWLITASENSVNEKIDNIIKSFVNQYVPCCLVPNNSATGLKGQWSFQVGHSSHKGYLKICIATNTWVRFEVDTLF